MQKVSIHNCVRIIATNDAKGTVERNILDLAARSGQSLYVKGKERGTVSADFAGSGGNISALPPKTSGKQQKGDYIFRYQVGGLLLR
jgi:hypothetical protein